MATENLKKFRGNKNTIDKTAREKKKKIFKIGNFGMQSYLF